MVKAVAGDERSRLHDGVDGLRDQSERLSSLSLDLSVHEAHMREVFAIARRARAHGNRPFGAMLVAGNGAVLAVAENSQITDEQILAHAEMNLLHRAVQDFTPDVLAASTLYTSAEPCAMCAGAIFWSGISRLVFGLSGDRLHRAVGIFPQGLVASARDVLATRRTPGGHRRPHLRIRGRVDLEGRGVLMLRARRVLETAVYCDDLARTVEFYKALLALEPMTRLRTRRLVRCRRRNDPAVVSARCVRSAVRMAGRSRARARQHRARAFRFRHRQSGCGDVDRSVEHACAFRSKAASTGRAAGTAFTSATPTDDRSSWPRRGSWPCYWSGRRSSRKSQRPTKRTDASSDIIVPRRLPC